MCAEFAGQSALGVSAASQRSATAPANAVETLMREREAFMQRHLPALPPAPEENVVAMFRNRSARFAAAPRWRAKRDGVWRSMTWSGNQALVNDLIVGLSALGVQPGTRVGILSETRWEWLAADWAILGLGAVTVPLYASLTPDVIGYMLNDATVEYVFVENEEMYEKLATASAPALKAIILLDSFVRDGEDAAARREGQPRILTFDALRRLSGSSPAQAEELAQRSAAQIRPEHIASIIYTSGTTNRPKGAIHTHASLMAQVHSTGAALTTFRPGMTHLLWLPLAHVLGREEHLLAVDRGGVTLIAESIDTLAQDIREARPNILVGVPRIYEKAYAAIVARVMSESAVQRRIFAWARTVGDAVVPLRQRHMPLPLLLRLRARLADWLVFRKVRAAFGDQVEFSITGGAPIALELLRFFHAAGIIILEGWGLTETMGAVTVNRIDNYRLGSVGLPTEGHEIRIAPDGEALIHGPCVFAGYQNNPAENAAALDSERWLHTGDLGAIDPDGFVYITGRKKELIVTANGKKIVPDQIESQLKGIEGVSQAFVYGDRKPYLVALLTLNPDGVRSWARRHSLPDESVDAVAQSPAFAQHLERGVERVNGQLARYETVKRFAVAPEDFTIENGLLTPTQKLRRTPLAARYQEAIERLYTTPETPETP